MAPSLVFTSISLSQPSPQIGLRSRQTRNRELWGIKSVYRDVQVGSLLTPVFGLISPLGDGVKYEVDFTDAWPMDPSPSVMVEIRGAWTVDCPNSLGVNNNGDSNTIYRRMSFWVRSLLHFPQVPGLDLSRSFSLGHYWVHQAVAFLFTP